MLFLNPTMAHNGLSFEVRVGERVKNAPVLLRDESTSHLDTLSEWQVRRAPNDLMKGRTTLIIAHRLATIKNADIIFVLKHGECVEQGSHHALMAQNSVYTELARMQSQQ